MVIGPNQKIISGPLSFLTDSFQLRNGRLSTLNMSTITLATASNDMSDGRSIDASNDDNPDALDKANVLLVVILSSSLSIAVSVAVVVIVLCCRTGRSTSKRTTEEKIKFTSKYDDRVTSIVSYCEIDDRNIVSIRLGQQQDDEGKYDCLGEGKFEKYKYTALNMLKDSNDR